MAMRRKLTDPADLDRLMAKCTEALIAELGRRRPGRPKSPNSKLTIGLRLDADIIAAFRATGPGWHTRINAALRRAIEADGRREQGV